MSTSRRTTWLRCMALLAAIHLAVDYPWTLWVLVPLYLSTEVADARIRRQQREQAQQQVDALVGHPISER